MWPQLTSMLPLWQWLILAAIPPAIVALYFLKLRRQPLLVPSTYLWRKSIEDLHVNSFWQRLRRNLLLLLQLLLMLLLLLALINPTWQGSQLSGNRFIFLVDNTASMSATDVKAKEGEPTRLDLAKRRVGELIDGMKPGDVAMLISFSDTGYVVQERTENKRELKRQLQAIKPTQRTTTIKEALRLAAGMANTSRPTRPGGDDKPGATPPAAEGQPATLFVLSDFRFAEVPDFSLGNLAPKFILIGRPEAQNVAITSFAARRYEDKPRELEAVGRIDNFSDQETNFTAEISMEGRLIDSREVKIPPQGQQTVAFPLSNIDSGALVLRIAPDDDLEIDNTAYAVVQPPRRGRILFVSPGDEGWQRALGTGKAKDLSDITQQKPNYLLTDEYQRDSQAGAWDLIIYDRCAPKKLPRANTLFIGRLPSDGRWKSGEKIVNPKVVDTERTHPLVQLVEVGDFIIAEAQVLRPPSGGASLFDAAEGPIFAIAPRESFQDAVLGFEFSTADDAGKEAFNTNWPLRPSFPVFVHEVLSFLGSGAALGEGEALRPGRPLEARSLMADEPAEVVTPSGVKTSLPVHQQTLLFTGTDEVGIYELRQGTLRPREFAVNLFSPAESDIRTRPDQMIKLGDVDVKPSENWETVRVSIVKALLLLALVVLMVEWYIYNRRVYV